MGKEKTHPQEYFVAGGIAGIVSRTAIAPIERVKILFQVGRAEAGSTAYLPVVRAIWRDEGVLAFRVENVEPLIHGYQPVRGFPPGATLRPFVRLLGKRGDEVSFVHALRT